METDVKMWRKSNTRLRLSTCLKILGNNTAKVKLASVQVEIHYAELWPIRIAGDLMYYYTYKDICKYTLLNKHQFTSHNMKFSKQYLSTSAALFALYEQRYLPSAVHIGGCDVHRANPRAITGHRVFTYLKIQRYTVYHKNVNK